MKWERPHRCRVNVIKYISNMTLVGSFPTLNQLILWMYSNDSFTFIVYMYTLQFKNHGYQRFQCEFLMTSAFNWLIFRIFSNFHSNFESVIYHEKYNLSEIVSATTYLIKKKCARIHFVNFWIIQKNPSRNTTRIEPMNWDFKSLKNYNRFFPKNI